jgi:uncharacterized membrane protein
MATMLAFIVLVGISSHLAPYVSRRDVFFGVTVPSSFRDGTEARAVSRRYAAEVWGLAAIAALLVVTSPMPSVSGPMLLAQTIGASVAYVRAWARVRPHAAVPATVREAAIGPREGLPGGLLGQLGPFLILLAAAAYVAMNWEHVPARFPTHWNLAGTPDGWTAKSTAGVFRGFGVGFVACAMLAFTSYAAVHWTRLPRVSGHDGQQHRRVRRVNLLALLASGYMIALLLSWTTVVAMFAPDPRALRLPLPIRVAPFALMLGATLVISVMRRSAAAAEPPVGDTTPDSCWILGRLYFNRADPVLFVERRIGIGYTLNLGNPWSWVVMTLFAAAMVLLLVLS